jgi:deazaflavin-dependent oxidoreductase (nitroreductase family)
VGGNHEGRPLLVLHHKGAKSGQARENPIMYQPVGNNYAVFATHGGAPTSPDWYHNLMAHPETTIEVGSETVPVRARLATDAEREPIWSRQKREFPVFAEYESRTTRKIPVVILERVR